MLDESRYALEYFKIFKAGDSVNFPVVKCFFVLAGVLLLLCATLEKVQILIIQNIDICL